MSNLNLTSGQSPLDIEGEKLVAAIALRIRQSLHLDEILNQTVEEVRNFLQTDRVLIYSFEPDWSGLMVVESVVKPWKAVFGSQIEDPCFTAKHVEQYRQGRIQVVEDIHTASLTSCHRDLLAYYEVQANLVVPIVVEDRLWGLLIAQHCQCPRKWHSTEIELLKQLACQVGIAVNQAEYHEQIQSLNIYLEKKVQKRTAKLQKSLEFEALIRRITENIRDSLDEKQILQAVSQELQQVLQVKRCKIELYSQDKSSTTIVYECAPTSPVCQGKIKLVNKEPALYCQLLQKQSLQFVDLDPEQTLLKHQATRLACPIFDDRGIIGNLWLIRSKEDVFDQFEIRLVEQIANQCAIAIRQARLYKQSQTQIKELEKLNALKQKQVEELANLNNLKDDFLKTISHELKTPMSSIQLASETLEMLLEKEIGAKRSATFTKVLDIFRHACKKQNNLVDDLLTLSYIDAKREILTFKQIDLKIWIPQIIDPFYERTNSQQQELIVNIAENIPLFNTDISAFKRVLSELVNNACKYTPAQETITISVDSAGNNIQITVSNSGVEIPPEEQKRVFEKFYRIPSHDPWQYGGTGIGLALVKKLVELLNGTIILRNQSGTTTFMMTFAQQE